jgi:hypothetical protein
MRVVFVWLGTHIVFAESSMSSRRNATLMNLGTATDREIVRAINSESIDAEDLAGRESWRRICQVRGRNFRLVDEEAWQSLCARRGYVLRRQNSRGF